MDWREHNITANPEICHGKPCNNGTRIPVTVILANLAAGVSSDQLHATYPALPTIAIRASLEYAAELAGERIVDLPE